MGIATTSFEHYGIDQWASSYFTINQKGELCLQFGEYSHKQIALKSLYQQLTEHNPHCHLPVILHFDHILKDRINYINDCFKLAKEKYHYQGHYQLAYPVKSNPSQRIINTLCQHSNKHQPLAFEVGSKAELLAVIGQKHSHQKRKIICNGFKDQQYLSLCQIAQTIGFNVIVIIEHIEEFKLIESIFSKEVNLPFSLGIRLKPLKIDHHALKFGLNLAQVNQIKQRICHTWQTQLVLLHAHHGSQIQKLETVISEVQRSLSIYSHLKATFPNLKTIDLGGGLAINYDANSSNSPDYSIETYAEAIIKTLRQYCDELSIDTPDIITESGRAIVSHSSIILTNLHHTSLNNAIHPQQIISKLKMIQTNKNKLLELFDNQKYDLLLNELFSLFYQQAINFDCYAELEQLLQSYTQTSQKDCGWLNLSIFQSLTDHWGINQAFPIMPIEHLDDACDKQVMLFDISCDKDGMIKHYTHSNQQVSNRYLPLSSASINNKTPLAIFLTASYQEVLGSYHNLIGRLPVVSVKINQINEQVEFLALQNESNYNILQHFGYDSDQMTLEISNQLNQLDNLNTQTLKLQINQILHNNPYLTENQIDNLITNLNILPSNSIENYTWSSNDEKSETLAG
ncbi:MAG: biosynthetic arginine decarboxylase [Gammaproteobacteria bacterium]|nr:MAG: biosynthetic arginine decarboxylase [Gammaproteobacteria bacterium]UTW42782.1 biosynthetic arginine decarboxylase [bacterium SCSIO 12844]